MSDFNAQVRNYLFLNKQQIENKRIILLPKTEKEQRKSKTKPKEKKTKQKTFHRQNERNFQKETLSQSRCCLRKGYPGPQGSRGIQGPQGIPGVGEIPRIENYIPQLTDTTGNAFGTSIPAVGNCYILGKLYIVNIQIYWNSISGVTLTDGVRLTLPSPIATSLSRVSATIGFLNGVNLGSGNTYPTAHGDTGNSYLYLDGWNPLGAFPANHPITCGDFSPFGELQVSVTYWID